MGVTKRDARNFDTICWALGGLEATHSEAMVSAEGEIGRSTKVGREIDLGLGAVECHADCSEVPLMYGEDVKGRAQGAGEGGVINDGREGTAVLGKKVVSGVVNFIECNAGTRGSIDRALLDSFRGEEVSISNVGAAA